MEVIRVESVSKLYDLGQVGTGTLSKDLNRWWAKVRGRQDPYARISQTNDRTMKANKDDSVWALKDINFSVNQGDVFGIVGRNGAGKSTLLKIISRITTPTTGMIKLKGRIVSLLEVGTGFHPEMTGRENIFMNGTLLGMTRKEIQNRLEEIIEFAGVQLYVDTPVKRYSSGMQVRLGFAVAAFLEPEILIVDEVLAVGDVEFQKKCLGKMKDVSGQGRTVLFVSHNMSAVETLCKKGIYLKNGQVNFIGTASDTILRYLQYEAKQNQKIEFTSIEEAIGNDKMRLMAASVSNALKPGGVIDVTVPLDVTFTIINLTEDPNIYVGYDLQNLKGETLFSSLNHGNFPKNKPISATCKIPADFLNDGGYSIYFYCLNKNMSSLFEIKDLLEFEVKDLERENGYLGKINGIIRPKFAWEIRDQIFNSKN